MDAKVYVSPLHFAVLSRKQTASPVAKSISTVLISNKMNMGTWILFLPSVTLNLGPNYFTRF